MIRNKEGLSILLERILKEKIERFPNYTEDLCDFSEKSETVLNNLDKMVNILNIPNIPIEIGEIIIII